MNAVTKLSKFFDDELQSSIKDVLITKDGMGRLTLFGEYFITPTDKYVKVRGKRLSLEFSNVKNALAYVTLHHAGKYSEANRIQHLDLSLCSVNLDLAVHRNILKSKTDTSSKMIYLIKVQEDTIKRRRIVNEIKSHINSSVRLQGSKFNASH